MFRSSCVAIGIATEILFFCISGKKDCSGKPDPALALNEGMGIAIKCIPVLFYIGFVNSYKNTGKLFHYIADIGFLCYSIYER